MKIMSHRRHDQAKLCLTHVDTRILARPLLWHFVQTAVVIVCVRVRAKPCHGRCEVALHPAHSHCCRVRLSELWAGDPLRSRSVRFPCLDYFLCRLKPGRRKKETRVKLGRTGGSSGLGWFVRSNPRVEIPLRQGT